MTDETKTPDLATIRENLRGLIEIMDYEDIPPQAALYSALINMVHLLTNLVGDEVDERSK